MASGGKGSSGRAVFWAHTRHRAALPPQHILMHQTPNGSQHREHWGKVWQEPVPALISWGMSFTLAFSNTDLAAFHTPFNHYTFFLHMLFLCGGALLSSGWKVTTSDVWLEHHLLLKMKIKACWPNSRSICTDRIFMAGAALATEASWRCQWYLTSLNETVKLGRISWGDASPQCGVTKAASFPFVPVTYSSTFLRAAVQLKQQSSTKGLWHQLLESDDPCTCCPGQDKLHLNANSPSHEQWLWKRAR